MPIRASAHRSVISPVTSVSDRQRRVEYIGTHKRNMKGTRSSRIVVLNVIPVQREDSRDADRCRVGCAPVKN